MTTYKCINVEVGLSSFFIVLPSSSHFICIIGILQYVLFMASLDLAAFLHQADHNKWHTNCPLWSMPKRATLPAAVFWVLMHPWANKNAHSLCLDNEWPVAPFPDWKSYWIRQAPVASPARDLIHTHTRGNIKIVLLNVLHTRRVNMKHLWITAKESSYICLP